MGQCCSQKFEIVFRSSLIISCFCIFLVMGIMLHLTMSKLNSANVLRIAEQITTFHSISSAEKKHRNTAGYMQVRRY